MWAGQPEDNRHNSPLIQTSINQKPRLKLKQTITTKVYYMVLVMLIIIIILFAYSYQSIKTGGKMPVIRPLAGMEAIKELTGRAAEMGRPCFFTAGIYDLYSTEAGSTVAGFSILTEVLRFYIFSFR